MLYHDVNMHPSISIHKIQESQTIQMAHVLPYNNIGYCPYLCVQAYKDRYRYPYFSLQYSTASGSEKPLIYNIHIFPYNIQRPRVLKHLQFLFRRCRGKKNVIDLGDLVI
jgi:hypothetical protein